MMRLMSALALVLVAGCAGTTGSTGMVYGSDPTLLPPPLDPTRKVSEQDCGKPVEIALGNLMCKEVTEAERRRQAEEERQRRLAAERRAKMEADEQAARERAERERAEQAARDAAALKARAAEEERLAAERKAREERERQEAEALARQRAEQEAREAAERERQRLEQDWLAGRALLEKFVANYGKVEKFKDVAVPITGFLDKTR